MQTNGLWTDFIADFMLQTEGAESPPLWRRWAAISCVAGALERRVWAKAASRPTFPNLYVLLVGPPGTGKFVVEDVRELWREAQEPGTSVKPFRTSPDNMTKASLMDDIAASKRTFLTPDGPTTYHSLLCAAEEFGVLLPDYDLSYIHSINSIWTNKELHEETRRTGAVRHLKIERPQLNILGGATPSYLATTFPEEAWTTGFARRLLMVYNSEPPQLDLFFEPKEQSAAKASVRHKLGIIAQLFGQMKWSAEAAKRLADWHSQGKANSGGPPIPTHSKLAHYCRSRTQHAIKLAIVSAVARTGALLIEAADIDRALSWMFEIEALMPDIFREMIGKSDSQVLEELHRFVREAYNRHKRQRPLSTALIEHFLMQRLPTSKLPWIWQSAERANVIARVAGTQDQWVPGRMPEMGPE